jgi:hypothetical protein
MSKEFHIAVVTRVIQKASGFTNDEKTAAVSSKELAGAIYFQADTLFDGEYPLPAQPSFPFASADGAGWFWVPKVNDTVMIEIDAGADQPDPRVVCMLYTNDNQIDDEFRTHYPWRMGLVTNSGHRLIFDDMEDEWSMKLNHTFGGGFEWDKFGNTIETVINNKIENVMGKKIQQFKEDISEDFLGSLTRSISKNLVETIKGNHQFHALGDCDHSYDQKLKVTATEVETQYGSLKQTIAGAKEETIDGGVKQSIGGGYSQSVVSNRAVTVGGNETKLITQKHDATYGGGSKENIPTVGKEFNILVGMFKAALVSGNIDLNTLAGLIAIKNILGGLDVDMAGGCKLGNLSGKLDINPAGMATLDGTMVVLGKQVGMVVTTVSSPVVDNITGAPQMGVTTVWAG